MGKSGVPTTCLALGANNVGAWVFSAVGDGHGTKTSVTGNIGSPGTTPLGACGPVTIVGGNGTGNPNTLPCQPEARVRHRSRPRRRADVAGWRDGDGGRPVVRLEDHDRS